MTVSETCCLPKLAADIETMILSALVISGLPYLPEVIFKYEFLHTDTSNGCGAGVRDGTPSPQQLVQDALRGGHLHQR